MLILIVFVRKESATHDEFGPAKQIPMIREDPRSLERPMNAILSSADFSQDQITPVHDARDLTDGGILARIRLDQSIYTLRITRQGKLILTK